MFGGFRRGSPQKKKGEKSQTVIRRKVLPRAAHPPTTFNTYQIPRPGREQRVSLGPPVRTPSTGIAISVALSIHNRSLLFSRALDGYMWQTLPPDRWEIILVDDMSTEDLRETYKHLIGKVNLRHILFDHTRHPIFRQKNPGWIPGTKARWYHTPALTLNLSFALARGPILCICHPEILHAPTNFERAVARLSKESAFLFGTTYLGIQNSNRWLDQNSWTNFGWPGFLANVGSSQLRRFSPKELYWYTSFLPTAAAKAVGGVDFQYLNGVAGEDDDFKERIKNAGWPPVYAPDIEGFHQDHSHEREAQHRRDTEAWRVGLKANRALFARRRSEKFTPWVANRGYDWTSSECFVGEISYEVGKTSPVVERRP